jgi:hypothetical protein
MPGLQVVLGEPTYLCDSRLLPLVALEEVAGVDFVMSLLYPLVCLFLTLFFLSNLADGANLLIFALFASGYNQFGDVFWSLFSEAAFKEGEAALFVG